MFSMWTMWLKKYSLWNLRALCASTSGRQVCGGKNLNQSFWRTINSRLKLFLPKLGISKNSWCYPYFVPTGQIGWSRKMANNWRLTLNYTSHMDYALKKIFSVKPPCPLCLYLRQTGLWWENTSTRFGEPLIPDWDQCGQNSNTEWSLFYKGVAPLVL